MSDIETRAATWSQPISEADPGGEDCRYDDEFEQVDMEIKKLQSVEGLTPDWPQVIEVSTMLLSTRTKDTTLLSSLCVALLVEEQYAGLAAGLKAYGDIVESSWEVMFPALRRLRGRAGDYTWMLQTLTRFLGTMQPNNDDYTPIAACREQFSRLDGLLRERFGDLHPAIGPFTRELEHHQSQTSPPPPEAPPMEDPLTAQETAAWAGANTPVDPEASPMPGAVGQPAPAAPPPPVVTGSAALSLDRIASDQQAEQVVEQTQSALKLVSEYYRQRSEQLEAEKKRLEDQLAYAGRVMDMQDQVDKMLSGQADEVDGDGDGDGESSED